MGMLQLQQVAICVGVCWLFSIVGSVYGGTVIRSMIFAQSSLFGRLISYSKEEVITATCNVAICEARFLSFSHIIYRTCTACKTMQGLACQMGLSCF